MNNYSFELDNNNLIDDFEIINVNLAEEEMTNIGLLEKEIEEEFNSIKYMSAKSAKNVQQNIKVCYEMKKGIVDTLQEFRKKYEKYREFEKLINLLQTLTNKFIEKNDKKVHVPIEFVQLATKVGFTIKKDIDEKDLVAIINRIKNEKIMLENNLPQYMDYISNLMNQLKSLVSHLKA